MTDQALTTENGAPGEWIDRADHAAINAALSDASTAFNAAYYESLRTADLRANVEATVAALNRVLRCITEPQGPPVHLAPEPGHGTTECCRMVPFELPGGDRITNDRAAVTCRSYRSGGDRG